MTQTAYNDTMTISHIGWTLVSEINCTFVVISGIVEVIGMDGAAPDENQHGIEYTQRGINEGAGEEAATDVLARFTGAGTADRLYMRGVGGPAIVFVSRAAVA